MSSYRLPNVRLAETYKSHEVITASRHTASTERVVVRGHPTCPHDFSRHAASHERVVRAQKLRGRSMRTKNVQEAPRANVATPCKHREDCRSHKKCRGSSTPNVATPREHGEDCHSGQKFRAGSTRQRDFDEAGWVPQTPLNIQLPGTTTCITLCITPSITTSIHASTKTKDLPVPSCRR